MFHMSGANQSSCFLMCRARLPVVSNFGDGDCGAGEIHTRARQKLQVASPQNFARVRVYFARPTIAIAKIRDYLQSSAGPVYII